MSAGGSMRFSGYFDFYFSAIQTGGDVVQQVNFIDQRVQNFTQTMKSSAGGAQNYASSLRRLALDFRLVGSSVRQIVTAMGLQNTIVGKAANLVVIFTQSMTGVISLYSIWSRLSSDLTNKTAPLYAIMMKFAGLGQFLLLNWLPVIAILALLAAGIIAVNYVWNETTGLNRYRESIKNLEEDVESLEDALRSLRLEQSALGVQSAALAEIQSNLDAQLAMGTLSAEEHAKQTEILDANRAVLAAQTAELTFTERYYQYQTDQSKDSIEDYQQGIKDINQAKWDMVKTAIGGTGLKKITDPLGIGEGISDLFRSLLGFESGGIVPVTGPIMAHAGEQVIPAGEVGGGGPISLTISLAGANIYGREGVEEALEVGGNKIRKQLEYMRRPRTRW